MEKKTDKIIKDLVNSCKERKIVSINELADEAKYMKTLETEQKELNDLISQFSPAFQEYMYMIDFLNNFADVVVSHPDMHNHSLLLGQAIDEASSHPNNMTSIYVNLWMLFDAQIEESKETIATISLETAKTMGGLSNRLRDLILKGSQSYMSFYVHSGIEDDCLLLREILTNKTHKALFPAEFIGEYESILFLRMFAPTDEGNPSIIMTAPYVIEGKTEKDVLKFFSKHGVEKNAKPNAKSIDFLKYGPKPLYWLEYIMSAYDRPGEDEDCIFLTGLPD